MADIKTPPPSRPSVDPLKAKLHSGYTPNTHFKERTDILGSVQYGRQIPDIRVESATGSVGFVGRVTGFFKDMAGSLSGFWKSSSAPASEQQILRQTEDGPFGLTSADIQQISAPGQSFSSGSSLSGNSSGLSSDKLTSAARELAALERGTLSRADITGLIASAFPYMEGTGTERSSSSPTATSGTTTPVSPLNPDSHTLLPPELSVTAGPAVENTTTPLNISVDGRSLSGTLVVITGLPAGSILSAGMQGSNDSWILTPAQLANLTLTPPPGWSGPVDMVVTALVSSDGQTASSSAHVTLKVEGLATTPGLSVTPASGVENAVIPLDIQSSLTDNDGSEVLSIVIGGVPPGAVLSGGVDNGDGTWTLRPGDLVGLTITPIAGFSGTLDLTVTAIATELENNSTASTSSHLIISISGVATAPFLGVQSATGVEGMPVALNISAQLVDTDGSETLSVIIAGVPAGAVLSAGVNNSNGSWTLTPAQLSGLIMTPPPYYSGDFDLTVTAISAENGTIASVSAPLPVTVTSVADQPLLSVQGAMGTENLPVSLSLGASLVDTDGSETLSVLIGGVPSGASLSAGVDNGDGTWTLTPGQLAGLTLMPPAHFSGTLNLTVTAIATEGNTTASTTSPLPVVLMGVAHPPVLSAVAAAGMEDSAIALNISAALLDMDGSESLSITISGVPAGAVLSAGTDNGDGTWTLTPGQLSGLTITPPIHFSGPIVLDVTATASEGGTVATTVTALPLLVTGVPDAAVLSASSVMGAEGTAIALNISASLVDTDGSETLSIMIGGVPAGAVLSAGTDNGDGTWTLTPAQLVGLTFTPPVWFSGNIALEVSAVSGENGLTTTVSSGTNVTVTGTATVPALSVTAAAGTEDTPVPLVINAALVDTDGSETLSVVISGIPAGAVLSAGTDNGDGTWTLIPAQLTGLTFTPPASYNGTIVLSVTAVSSENGTNAQTSTTLPVVVAGVADTPALQVQTATGSEDTPVPLIINAALTDTGGAAVLALTIAGIPPGAVLSAGTDNGDGTWTLTPAELAGLTFTPPANYSGQINLNITATSTEGDTMASAAAVLPVVVGGVADTPVLNVQPASGVEDTAIVLNITTALADMDGSETLSITISGVPAGAILSAGTDNGDGSWTLTPDQLSDLTITPPANFSGSISLGVTAAALEDGAAASVSVVLPVSVTGDADAPVLSIVPATGGEDTAIALNITAVLADPDSETLSIMIGNVPVGAVLSAGTDNGDGTWTLTPNQLDGLTITPLLNYSGSFSLVVTALSSESGTIASTSVTLPVLVTGTVDRASLTIQPAAGLEDFAIELSIMASLNDLDSEVLSVIIAGMPAGALLSAGINNGDGTWTLTPDELAGLTLLPPPHFSGSLSLTVTAVATENGATASISAVLPVVVAGMADAPLLTVYNASGREDSPVALTIIPVFPDVDGSETVSITIGGVPAGAILSAGIDNGDGTWTLAPAQLTGLTFTPPANYNGTVTLSVTVTISEDGTTASTSTALPVTISGEADAPVVQVQSATGNEDEPIALSISAGLAPRDTGVLEVVIAGVPAGAALSAGMDNGDGTWILTPGQLTGLTLTPPANFSGQITLTVTATAIEGGTTAITSSTLSVMLEGAADAPTLSVQPSAGNEDTPIALNISATLVDTDGSESLSIVVSNVPVGAVLSSGIDNGDGTWILTPGQLTGLTLTPPANYNGTIQLGIAAITSEDGTTAQATAALPVTVAGVADTPTVSVQPATGVEDAAVPLVIHAALAAGDTGSLSIIIGSVPAGAVLSAGSDNGDGTWTLTPTELSGLTITPPDGFSGGLSLSVTAVSLENGTTASATAALPVSVSGVADTPVLSAQVAPGSEDTPVPLVIGAALTDPDSELLFITISGVPAGAVLSAGISNGDGSWTLTPDQLTGLYITPPANWSGSFTLSIAATATEGSTTATTTTTLPVIVGGVADTPTLSVQAATGATNTAIPISISSALTDTDGSESLSIRITGVPSGATLSAGVKNPDGSWTLTPAQLTGLTLTPAANYSGSLSLTVTATASENSTTNTTTATLPVTVTGVADAPTLTVQAGYGNEDSSTLLNISAALTDISGSETLSIVISNLPTGAMLSAGTNNGNGTWTLTPAQLTNLYFIPAANWSGQVSLTVTAISSENGTTASTSATLPVTYNPIADKPTLSVQVATGAEDTAIPLNIASALVDTDGSEVLTIRVYGLPAGATLSAGTDTGGGTWLLTPAQLTGLTLAPPANWSGQQTITVVSTATEPNGSNETNSLSFQLTATGVADKPTLTVQAATGTEDNAVSLNITSALTDTDSSETLTVNITGVPSNATLSAGSKNADGSWTLTGYQLSGLSLTPAANYSGSVTLTVTATASENGTTNTTTATLPVTIGGVADMPTLTVQSVTGNEGANIPLTITAGLTDTDGSETLSIRISNVPSGAILSAGTKNADGTWTLTPGQLSGLTMTPPVGFSGNISLGVAAISSENGTTAQASNNIAVTVLGVATTPTVSVVQAAGNEGSPIPLTISAALTDTDGSESLSIRISGIPSGATLSSGSNYGGGVWVLTPAQLSGLTITPPAYFSGAFTLAVDAISSENGTTAQASTTLPVTVNGVASTPTLSTTSATGAEDAAIYIYISTSLKDTDGSEKLSITVSGVPDGATLSAGLYAGNGKWSLTTADLVNLRITPPANFTGAIALQVSAVATEANGDSTKIDAPLNVTVTPVADVPTLTALAASGKEDTAIPLSINAALFDTSETLSIRIAGVPTGATLSAGTNAGGGIWNLTPAQLVGLKITQVANSDADMTLTVTAYSTESNGLVANRSVTLPVTVIASADIPTISASNTSGTKNTSVSVTISGALTDSSETLTYEIRGVPDGFSLTAGLNNGNNTWTLTPAQLSGLKMVAPYNFEGRVFMTVVSVSRDNDSSTALSNVASFNVGFGNAAGGTQINLGEGIGTPGIGTGTGVGIGTNSGTMLGTGGLILMEDSTYLLSDAASLVTLQSNTNRLTLSGLPTTATLSLGTNQGGGSWRIESSQFSQLSTLTITMAPNSSNDFTITTTARYSGNNTRVVATTAVRAVGVADQPTLTTSNATASEDATSIPITVTSALTDTDASETLSFMISGMPTGFTLTAGTDNGNGTWSLTAAQLTGLAIKPAANFSGTATYTVTATATETEGDSSIRTATGTLTINAVADAPTIATTLISGTEDQALLLSLSIGLVDTDGSESISAITISGLPTGATLTNATSNGDGTWSVAPASLAQVQMVPPANYSGDFNLSVTATSREGASGPQTSTTASVPVHIEAAADQPNVATIDSAGDVGTSIPLYISAALTDTDGSEVLSIVIGGLAEDSLLSAGVNNGDGTWTLTRSQLSGLTVTPPPSFSGDMNLTVTALSRDNNATTNSTQQNVTVHVTDPAQSASMFSSSEASRSWLDDGTAMSSTSTANVDTSDLFSSDTSTSAPASGSDYDNPFEDKSNPG